MISTVPSFVERRLVVGRNGALSYKNAYRCPTCNRVHYAKLSCDCQDASKHNCFSVNYKCTKCGYIAFLGDHTDSFVMINDDIIRVPRTVLRSVFSHMLLDGAMTY